MDTYFEPATVRVTILLWTSYSACYHPTC
jgi:hypothetical protein